MSVLTFIYLFFIFLFINLLSDFIAKLIIRKMKQNSIFFIKENNYGQIDERRLK